MPATCVIGVQWGDEGKGKIVDVLAEQSDFVVRYQGGGNAGHTVVVGDRKFVLHLVPSGILQPGRVCVIGNGVVVDPAQLFEEIATLSKQGVDLDGRIVVSDRAHVVFPYHKLLDSLSETARGAGQIGTTKRGIGPCYADKVARVGIRVADLLNADVFAKRLRQNVEEKNLVLRQLGHGGLAFEDLHAEYCGYRERLRPFVKDAVDLVNRALDAGKRVLFEGAQGTMLDVDFGTYPYVTSSSSDVAGVSAGTGVSPRKIGRVIGVAKAYATRVGSGPFPTELSDALGGALREKGQEFGATTGRPRRCGWFDLVSARYAVQLNGIDALAITKLDVLDDLPELSICTEYRWGSTRTDRFPADIQALETCAPVYETLPGWRTSTTGVRRFEDFPPNAKRYLQRLAEALACPIQMVSVGAERDEMIYL